MTETVVYETMNLAAKHLICGDLIYLNPTDLKPIEVDSVEHDKENEKVKIKLKLRVGTYDAEFGMEQGIKTVESVI